MNYDVTSVTNTATDQYDVTVPFSEQIFKLPALFTDKSLSTPKVALQRLSIVLFFTCTIVLLYRSISSEVSAVFARSKYKNEGEQNMAG